jgi:hypothetical protein
VNERTRIQGVLANVGHKVGRGTVANVLSRNGIEPVPERGKRTRWSTFLKAHWKMFAASDFLTVEVWTGRGLVTYYLLFVISLADRAVGILGTTSRPDEAWTLQLRRNLIDAESGALRGKRYLIIDRDTKYTEQFRRLVCEAGTEVIRLPPMAPCRRNNTTRDLFAYRTQPIRRLRRLISTIAATERTSPGRMSLASVANEWAANMNSSPTHWYSTSRGTPYRTAPRGCILMEQKFAMDRSGNAAHYGS